MLSVSGPITLTQTAAGRDGGDDSAGLAGTLIAGNLSVYINDPNGLFTSDELARIQDAINTWDALLVPYNVAITEVTDPTLANVVIDTSSSTACGGAAQGVLGCYDSQTSEITLVQGWNWYAGTDPSGIGAAQYDFETTVAHELGHALGLGHSSNPGSPMYATLAAGVVDRTVFAADLNIPDPPAGADPLTAASFVPVSNPPSATHADGLVSPALLGIRLISSSLGTMSSSGWLTAQGQTAFQAGPMSPFAIAKSGQPNGDAVALRNDGESADLLPPHDSRGRTTQTALPPMVDLRNEPLSGEAAYATSRKQFELASSSVIRAGSAIDSALDELALEASPISRRHDVGPIPSQSRPKVEYTAADHGAPAIATSQPTPLVARLVPAWIAAAVCGHALRSATRRCYRGSGKSSNKHVNASMASALAVVVTTTRYVTDGISS